MLDAVLTARVPLLVAAKEVKAAGRLVSAYRSADREAKLAFAAAVSPESLWDEAVVPVLSAKPTSTIPSVEDAFEALPHAA
jgi:hypothetical protein